MSRKHSKHEERRPHFEMSVEAWLDQQRPKELSQWSEPIRIRPPEPSAPKGRPRFTVVDRMVM